MPLEAFSDYFAHKDNLLTRIDARIKMLFVFGVMIIILSSGYPYVPLIVSITAITFLLGIRVPAKTILFRLIAPLSLAGVVLCIQIFFYGTTPIIERDFWIVHLVGYKEGLLRGFLITGKIIGAVSAVLFLSMTTPANKLIRAAAWLKIPRTWVEIAMLTYRYVFVLLEDAMTVRDAQRMRLGYTSLARSIRSLGDLIGTVVIRAYNQSIATAEAMMLRGYNGSTDNRPHEEKFTIKDVISAFICVVILGALLTLNIVL